MPYLLLELRQNIFTWIKLDNDEKYLLNIAYENLNRNSSVFKYFSKEDVDVFRINYAFFNDNNEEKILAIFNIGNKTINNSLMKRCEYDKELEEIMMKNDDLKKYYSMYVFKNKL